MSDNEVKQVDKTDKNSKPKGGGFLGKVGRWIKKHIKLIIFLAVVIFIAVFVIRIVVNVKKAAAMLTSQSQSMTTEVKTMDLSKTVSVTGTLEANDTRTVKAAVSEAKIATIDVEVGDYVKAGDTIMTYDSEDLKDNLEDVEKQVNLDDYKSDYSTKSSYNNQEDQQWTHDRQLEKLTADLQTLRNYYNALLYGNDDYSGKEFYEKHIEDYWELNAFNVNFQSYVDTSGQKHGLNLPIERKQSMDEDGDTEYEYDGDYDDVVTDFGAKLMQYEKDYIEFLNQNDDKLDDSEYNYNVASMQSDIDHDKTEKKLQDAKDDLAETIVTAPISGVITSISVEEGDKVYSSEQNKTVLCVIQDTTAFKVTGTVDEYDIATLQEGQRAVVKTDSTGDDEFPATLTFVAPTLDATTSVTASSSSSSSSSAAAAAMGASSSSSSSGFEVELSLDKFDDRLRVGMTAKTSIILDEISDVLAVPYDCVKTDDDGNKYVNVIKNPALLQQQQQQQASKANTGLRIPGIGGIGGSNKSGKAAGGNGADTSQEIDNNREKVIVEVVFESDYYIAIKGDGIEEGTIVEATESSGSHDMSFGQMMGGGGGPGGAPGGGGPGGGPGGM